MPSRRSRPESKERDRQTACIDVHLHPAQTSSPTPARSADPFLFFSFGGWSSAGVSGSGLHLYGMVFDTLFSCTNAAVSDRHKIIQSVRDPFH